MGAKAAWLARGRRAGLPVLPGLVLTTEATAPLLSLGARLLEAQGSGRARLGITGSSLPSPVAAALTPRLAELGEPLVVRSSNVLEGAGEWSGAFTSYQDVLPDEVPKAVLGCVASVFTVHALQRFEAAGIDPGRAHMGVVVQPQVHPEAGGTAEVTETEVVVVGTPGSPAPLVQGWEPGVQARVDRMSGRVRGETAVETLSETTIAAVADAAMRSHEAVGATVFEWAARGDRVIIFQLGRPARAAHRAEEAVAALGTPAAVRVDRWVRRFPGPLGEELVLPWALGMPDPTVLDTVGPVATEQPAEALAEALRLAGILMAEVWTTNRAAARARSAELVRGLRGNDAEPALRVADGLRAPDAGRAAEVVALLRGVGDTLHAAGLIAHRDLVWRLPVETVASALRGNRLEPVARIGFDRWEPFTAAVVAACGRRLGGTSAGPGTGAGRMCIVLDAADTQRFRPRDVIVARHPLPNLAPLLWDAAGIVTTGGGPAAHLFESARSLGIPAVAGCRIEEALGAELGEVERGHVVMVDGWQASVAVMDW